MKEGGERREEGKCFKMSLHITVLERKRENTQKKKIHSLI
jgi:hypothetical protein